jgi:hypothetical protein
VLAPVSRSYSAPQGRFPRVTHPCATKAEAFVRLACVRHAASVRSEPGSNSQVEVPVAAVHAHQKQVQRRPLSNDLLPKQSTVLRPSSCVEPVIRSANGLNMYSNRGGSRPPPAHPLSRQTSHDDKEPAPQAEATRHREPVTHPPPLPLCKRSPTARALFGWRAAFGDEEPTRGCTSLYSVRFGAVRSAGASSPPARRWSGL